MRKVAFHTLGCKVNQYETNTMITAFKNKGYEVVDFEDIADIYVVNTCTVTSMGDRKSRQIVRRAKRQNPTSVIAVVGCYSQVASPELEKIPEIDVIAGTSDRIHIVELCEEALKGTRQIKVADIMKVRKFQKGDFITYTEKTRAFIKIQDGCDRYCTYCIIPYARGPVRSREPEDIIEEINELTEKGFVEVVLTGIHLASYGKDLKTTSLVEIIKQIAEIDKIKRIRLGSIEPNTITEEFVETIKHIDKVCPHFHVSLQSGCDETLKRMNRRYSAQEYMDKIKVLRDNITDCAVTTDVMVGFPGETDEEFEKTYRFLDEISFSKMHVFKYSPRKGTPAANYESQVDPHVKEIRSQRLIELSDKKEIEFLDKFIGRDMEVLFEDRIDDKFIEGHTINYLKVLVESPNELKGSIINTHILELKGNCLVGKL